MKFHLAINLERTSPSQDMGAVAQHTLDMVKMADQGGFEIAWAAEHHALEMTIAPNPFQLLTWWAQHTNQIRLGCGVRPTPPTGIRLRSRGMRDARPYQWGRPEFGLVQARISANLIACALACCKPMGGSIRKCCPSSASFGRAMWRMRGNFVSFSATSCPKPVQAEVPIMAARSPITFDYAVRENANIMSWPPHPWHGGGGEICGPALGSDRKGQHALRRQICHDAAYGGL